jgi:UDP-N-acetylmuramoyl-tripeptide--D-alanyl-D-alanine ligase
MNAFVVVAALMAIVITGPRWLRVAQREHYLLGATTRFAMRWWLNTGLVNAILLVVASAGFVAVWFAAGMGLLCAGVEIVGPVGLSPRGRTSKLAWTRRLRTTAAVAGAIDAAAIVVGVVLGKGAPVATCVATLQPIAVEGALAICAPF